MKKAIEITYVYLVGAVLYCCFEVAIRGRTHWTMALTGGLAFLLLYRFNLKVGTLSVALRGLFGCGLITGLEFIVGCVVNRTFGWRVWDYSARGGHILGQICPMFSIVWFVLSLSVIPLSFFLKAKLFADTPGSVKPLRVPWFFTPVFRRRKKAHTYPNNCNTNTGQEQ